jgi:4-amino-4-deoxy-L-arabinose transferase-like glycosyltransferase
MWGFCFWVAAALGFLVKGPFALLYPIGTILLILPFTHNRLKLLKSFFSLPGIAIFLILVLPWFVYVYLYTDAAAIFAEEVAQRITSSRGKSHSLFFYLESLTNFSPWLIVLPLALWWAIYAEMERSGLVIAWLVGGLIIASLISAKNHHYILPLYPAMGLLTGRYIAVHIKGELNAHYILESVSGWLGIFISFLAFLILAVLPFAHLYSGEVPQLNPYINSGLMVVCALLFVMALRFMGNRNFVGLWSCVIGGLYVTLVFAHGFVVPELNSRNSHKNFLENIAKVVGKDSPLRMYRIENFQTTFYLNRSAPVIWTKNDLESFANGVGIKDVKRYLITEKRFAVEALNISAGKTVLTDNYYIPPTDSKDGNRFVLIEVNLSKEDKL